MRIKNQDDTSYMMAVSDVMSGLMFIFIITLAIFVIDFLIASREQEDKYAELQKYTEKLKGNNEVRSKMLSEIQRSLADKSVDVEIDIQHGVLRLNENAIRFDTGAADLNEIQVERLGLVAEVIAAILPCYGANPPIDSGCIDDTKGKIDSIFIEGHTDNMPITGWLAQKYQDNWVLSAHRAMFTYREVTKKETILAEMKNNNNQPVISVSGYGEGRPVPGHEYETPMSDPINRRIDFRFIMTPPSITEAEAALEGNFE
ncbi:OmpA/MotB family protein [Shewanella glacialipiscicola]|uniref:OmpA/MotB family protein n=1 Tax=Shewanella glacialipiscicola TaxID=614069 RepID=UPI003D79D3CD